MEGVPFRALSRYHRGRGHRKHAPRAGLRTTAQQFPRTASVHAPAWRGQHDPRSKRHETDRSFSDFQNRVTEALRNSPAADIEKNVRAMMTQGFSKLDLVTREEFDVQSQVLARTRARLEELETRVAALEAQLKSATPADQ